MIHGRHELCQEKMWVGSLVPLNGGGETDGKRQQKQKERNRWYHEADHPDMIGTSNNPNSNKKTSPDFCFDTFLNRVAIRHDLLLLENQLPFFVLEDLFDLMVARIPIHLSSLSDYLLSYFGNMMNPLEQSDKNDREPKIFHILHFLYNQYCQQQSHKNDPEPKSCHIIHFLYNLDRQKQEVPSITENKKEQQDSPKINSMPPASELEYAGVKFEVSKDNPFEVQFEDPPVLFWCFHRASLKILTLRISADTKDS